MHVKHVHTRQDTQNKIWREHLKLLEARGKQKWWGTRMNFLTWDILILFTFYKHGLLFKLTEAIKIKNNK